MTDRELMQQALEALNRSDYLGWQLNIPIIKALRERLAQPEQEPVAWLHTKIEGVAVPHRPADLDKHPDRWEALYKTPPPCPTCEALARTVMLDQTYYELYRAQRPWQGLTDEDLEFWTNELGKGELGRGVIRAVADHLKERNT